MFSTAAASLTDTFRALQAVQLEVETLNSQSGLKKFWSSYDQTGSLKKLQEKVRTALEELQVSLVFHDVVSVNSRKLLPVAYQFEHVDSGRRTS